MQQAVLCYFSSTQISLLLCLRNRGVHCEIDVYSFKELSCSGLDTVGVRLSCIYAVSVWRPPEIRRLFFSRFYTSVVLFLHMSGTPVPYRHLSICQVHQCLTAFLRIHVSGTPVPFRHFCIYTYEAHQCLSDISAYTRIRHTSAFQTLLHTRVSGTPVPFRHFCIHAYQAHQCLTDISAYTRIRHTSALQTLPVFQFCDLRCTM